MINTIFTLLSSTLLNQILFGINLGNTALPKKLIFSKFNIGFGFFFSATLIVNLFFYYNNGLKNDLLLTYALYFILSFSFLGTLVFYLKAFWREIINIAKLQIFITRFGVGSDNYTP
ncbi:MAG: hypothetical protein H7230_03200 [Candidatus Parcubacteria bacterium]|nr:hypothetical protein [Candidatus Paceibacterota bacterium]